MTIDKILCPVDFSQSSMAAAHLAARLARANGATLTLAHVLAPSNPGVVMVEPMIVPAALTTRLEAAQVASTHRRLEALAAELAEGGDGEASIKTIIRHGATIEQLLEVAAEVDLVVIGTEGGELIPQHVAVGLARDGATPVLACPDGGDRDLSLAVVAVDFSPGTIELATTAASLVGDVGLVEVVHVHPAESLDVEGVNRDAHWLELIAARTETGATVRGYVGRGSLASALLSRATELEADLIAVGVEPSDAERSLGLAEELVGQTPVPLLLVPTPAAPA